MHVTTCSHLGAKILFRVEGDRRCIFPRRGGSTLMDFLSLLDGDPPAGAAAPPAGVVARPAGAAAGIGALAVLPAPPAGVVARPAGTARPARDAARPVVWSRHGTEAQRHGVRTNYKYLCFFLLKGNVF